MASNSANDSTPIPESEEQTSPSHTSKSPVYIHPSSSPAPSQPGPDNGDSPDRLSPSLRSSESNIPVESPTSPTPKPSQASQSPLPAPPPLPIVKRKLSDSVSLSPPSRKRRVASDSEEVSTPPPSLAKQGMCTTSPLTQELTPKSQNETPEAFKTPRKPLLTPKIIRKRRLEFKEPDPETFTSLTELFDYDDMISRKPRVLKLPQVPLIPPSNSDEIFPLQHLICEEKFL